jgi:tRNA(His) guanylyltransferase
MDALGDRMKDYERRETGAKFLPMLPVYARIDGRGFSRFTQGLERPFDRRFREAMLETTKALVGHTHAKIGYTQSDEISLCWMSEHYDGEVFFDGKKQKMVSQLAALATAFFTRELLKNSEPSFAALAERIPTFDARIFQLPTIGECANAFLWREMDASKNALSMAARHYYSHKELMGKNGSELNEMLFKKGINFNDYPSEFKRGTFVRRETFQKKLSEEERLKIPVAHRPGAEEEVTRSRIVAIDMPIFSRVANRTEVIFERAAPVLLVSEDNDEKTGERRGKIVPQSGSPKLI